MSRIWFLLGALAGLSAVGLSAYAAHGLAEAARPAVGQALNMQGWHALALLAVGFLAERRVGRAVSFAGLAFAVGMAMFCGAVWYGALTGESAGRIAPIGGMLLMAGWVAFGLAAWRR
ncbi:uncharacterized membrane protein YgdD (TMEM256/DUF423 family) [Humitalea rosea]|uniref:Uncharacterized membrane protein YgdD (TMEM256/DUF423 family) n=1 Tax=Humitalea rosea TaxID=990373 RepID=A0A2W7IE71_9PROT|nr:DUF423 domain-containing protein [Humitalea rosea]PZW45045.1 uncharacterized membrane protein YgdD (TMEM256/DUF423 family) [Humitalea rosea]